MKIIITDLTMGHGGAERVISILVDELIMRGHDVELLLYYSEKIFYSINEKVNIVCDEKEIGHKANTLKHILWRRKHIKESKADIVLSFLAPMNMVNIIAMYGVNIPLIVADRNDPRKVPFNKYVRKVRDFLYRFADGIVLQNYNNRNYFSDYIQQKSHVIYNPVNVGRYRGIGLHTAPKKKIVSVGRLIQQKNPLMLLDAFKNISSQFPEYELIFYGEGEMRAEIQDKAKRYNLEDKVMFPGNLENIFEHIKDSDVFVLSSWFEGMPNALMEAMCIGLPVISTKVSGATDIIKNEENGILIDCGDVQQLTAALYKLLINGNLRNKLATNAVKLSDELQQETIVDEWIDYIKFVLDK